MRSNMTIFLFAIVCALLATVARALIPSSTNPADDLMHSWCESIGVEISPSVRLMTTPASVAGRGVFAVEPLEDYETIAYIPTYAMFHPKNAANMFPDVAEELKQRWNRPAGISTKEPKRKLFGRLLHRIFPRRGKTSGVDEKDIPWQVELTEYALAALKEEHPFQPWIQQWKRDDPVRRLFEKEDPTEEDVKATAAELQQMVPELSLYKILAALNIRMEEYLRFKTTFSDPSHQTAAMYTTVTSRTIGVTDEIVSVVPFHDMLNHDFQPNVGLGFSDDGKQLVLFALGNIAAGDELFLSYTTTGKEYSEDAAVWLLVQWGIPVAKSDWKVDRTEPRETVI